MVTIKDKPLNSRAILKEDICTDDFTVSHNTKSNILVFMDTFWEYKYIVNYLSFVLERMNVCKHGSTVHMMTAANADILVSHTSSMLTVYQSWKSIKHSLYAPGFNFTKILQSIQRWAFSNYKNGDDNENSFHTISSHIVLIVPSPNVFVSEAEINFCHKLLEQIHELLPDVHIIFFAGGALTRFENFVQNPKEDLYPLNFYLDFESTCKPVVERIQNVARSIRLPICRLYNTHLLNSSITQQGQQHEHKDHIEIAQCIQQEELIFYSFNPMKHSKVETSFIQIQTTHHIGFTICVSRTNSRPRKNFVDLHTNHKSECYQILSSSFNFALKNLCDDYADTEICPPVYISVQAPHVADIENLFCKAQECQLPQSLLFSIIFNNFECNGSANRKNKISFILYLIYTLYIILQDTQLLYL